MADKKVGLGRGIGALIPSATPTNDRPCGSAATGYRVLIDWVDDSSLI